MHVGEAADLIRKMDAIWPMKDAGNPDSRAEWIDFLVPLDYSIGMELLSDLRETLKWHPAMSEFREAYNAVLTRGALDLDLYALPAAPDAGSYEDTLTELYGSAQNEWVYCWKCSMAIGLEERATDPRYRPSKGLHHAKCPKNGMAPSMPVWMKLEQENAKRSRA